VAILPFLAKKTLLRFTRPKFHKAMFKEIFACGSPIFLSNIAGRVTSILMNISLMTVGARVLGENGGTTAVAVYAILMYSSDLCWPLLYGISDSLAPALGYNWGAQNYTRVKKIVKCGYIGTAIVGLISTAALFLFPDVVASLFANRSDTQLLQISTDAIRLFCPAYLFRWFVVTTQGFLSAIKKPMAATMLSVAVALVFPVLMLGALWSLELDGIWLNFVGVNLLAAVMGVFLLGSVRKEIKKKELEKNASPISDPSETQTC